MGVMRVIHLFKCFCVTAGVLAGTWSLASAETPALQSSPPSVRRWSDSSGRFHTDAILVSGNSSVVRLQKATGSVITVPFARLSLSDRQFVLDSLQAGIAAASSTTTVSGSPDATDRADTPMSYLANKPVVSDAITAMRSGTLFASRAPKVPENMIYVQLSRRFLQQLIARDISQRRPVNDYMLGSTVTGVSQTEGSTEIALTPNSQFGQLEIHLSGTTTYHTVADAGPIQVFVSGVTQFASAKAVQIDEQGIHLGAAATNTQTSSTISGIETSLPRLRGRIALRFGGARAAESQQLAREITGQHTQRRINERFDETTRVEMADLWKGWCTQIAKLPADDPLRPRGWQASTTDDALQIVFLSRRGEQRVPAPAEVHKGSDVVVQINAVVVNRALTDGDFHQLLGAVAIHPVAMRGSKPSGGPTMQWSDDHCWLSISWNGSDQPTEPQSQTAKLASEAGDSNR
jgi:hypothetical protein